MQWSIIAELLSYKYMSCEVLLSLTCLAEATFDLPFICKSFASVGTRRARSAVPEYHLTLVSTVESHTPHCRFGHASHFSLVFIPC